MNLHENTVFGRKIFFLHPPYNVEKIVLQKLLDMEYEIYTIDDWKKAKSILRLYPDSICFINIDSTMPAENWFNFVMSFEQDEILSTIFLGVISERARKIDRERFLLHATIPAGFISMNMDLEDLTQTLAGILEINGAKGRRKYVRAEGIKDKSVYCKCHLSNRDFSFPIDSISSVGLSGILQSRLLLYFPVNTVFRDLTIVLHTKEIHCGAAVIANKLGTDTFTMVLLFLKGTPYSTKSAIRNFIRQYLQSEIMSEVVLEAPDATDYSKAIEGSSSTMLVPLNDDEATDIEELDELEEIPNNTPTKEPDNNTPEIQYADPDTQETPNFKSFNSPTKQPTHPPKLEDGGEGLDSTITSLF